MEFSDGIQIGSDSILTQNYGVLSNKVHIKLALQDDGLDPDTVTFEVSGDGIVTKSPGVGKGESGKEEEDDEEGTDVEDDGVEADEEELLAEELLDEDHPATNGDAAPEEIDNVPEEMDAVPEEMDGAPEEMDAIPEEIDAGPDNVSDDALPDLVEQTDKPEENPAEMETATAPEQKEPASADKPAEADVRQEKPVEVMETEPASTVEKSDARATESSTVTPGQDEVTKTAPADLDKTLTEENVANKNESPPDPSDVEVLVPLTVEDKIEMDSSQIPKTEDDVSLIVHVDDTSDFDYDSFGTPAKKPKMDGEKATTTDKTEATSGDTTEKQEQTTEAEGKTADEPKTDEEKKTTAAEEEASKKQDDDDKSAQAKDAKKDDKVKTNANNLWVSGLSTTTRATDLKAVFSKHGKVSGAKIVTNLHGPKSRCYGFVVMASEEDAETCIRHLHRTELHGRLISVERPKSDAASSAVKSDSRHGERHLDRRELDRRRSGGGGPGGRDGVRRYDDRDRAYRGRRTPPRRRTPPPADKEKKKEEGAKPEEAEKKEGETDAEKPAAEGEEVDKEVKKEGEGGEEKKDGEGDDARSKQSMSKSPRRSESYRRDRDVLSFDKIKEERERERRRRHERLERERERRRQEEIQRERYRQRQIARQQEEEAFRLRRERDRIREERERLEAVRVETERLERERQKLERERKEHERRQREAEIRRLEQLRYETEQQRRALKRPYESSSGARDDWDNKRSSDRYGTDSRTRYADDRQRYDSGRERRTDEHTQRSSDGYERRVERYDRRDTRDTRESGRDRGSATASQEQQRRPAPSRDAYSRSGQDSRSDRYEKSSRSEGSWQSNQAQPGGATMTRSAGGERGTWTTTSMPQSQNKPVQQGSNVYMGAAAQAASMMMAPSMTRPQEARFDAYKGMNSGQMRRF